MWITRCVAITALLLAPGLGLWGCSDDTEAPLDLGVNDDTTQLPDGPSVDKKLFLDAPPFLDQGPDMAPDMVAVDSALPDAPLPDKSCGTGKIACNCIYNGIKLYGKYKEVSYGEDIKIQVVNFAQDLRVEKTNFPTKCGQWKLVSNFPDFKVKIVSYGQDIKVKYVNFNPGL